MSISLQKYKYVGKYEGLKTNWWTHTEWYDS